MNDECIECIRKGYSLVKECTNCKKVNNNENNTTKRKK